MRKELIKALNLPNELIVKEIKNQEREIIICCKAKKIARCCPACNKKTNISHNKTHNRKLHTVINGKKLYLEIEKRRLKCKNKECNKVFTEKIKGMEKERTTDFFTQLVQEKSRNQDFTTVANELGIHASTVMRKQDLLSLDQFQVPKEKELHLGLDGKYVNSDEEIFVVGEVKLRKFLGITKTNKAADLEKVLKKNIIDTGKIVKTVSMDMSKLLKGLSEKLFPDAEIIADKFHVILCVSRTIDVARIAVEKSLNQKFQIKRILLMKNETITKIKDKPKWKKKIEKFKKLLKTNEEIRILWDLKNRIHGFYKCKTIEAAEQKYAGLIKFLDFYTKVHPEFEDLKKTLTNWRKEILNYFIFGFTNAFIEGLNNRIETLKRKKFGFRNKNRFLKSVIFALLPITIFISNLIFIY